jgi:hypothetical protein
MSRQRDSREAKALAFLRLRHRASALEIGAAAVRGEAWARNPKVWKAVEQIGLALAVTFVRAATVRPTRSNMFELT